MEAAGKRYILHPSRSDWLTIWDLADLHDGNAACALDTLKEDIEQIRADPHSFWFGGGDYAEYISATDKRFKANTIASWLTIEDLGRLGTALRKHVRALLQPIRHKCLGLLLGNHEEVYQRIKEQEDLHAWLCTDLNVPNLGYSALCDVIFVRRPQCKQPKLLPRDKPVPKNGTHTRFRFYLHHGAGGAQTEGGKLNKLVQFMDRFDADIYMIGHVHDQIAKRLVQLGADEDCKRIVARQRLGIVTGSYLKTYASGVTGYGEKKGYKPVPLGARFVRIHPETKEAKAEI